MDRSEVYCPLTKNSKFENFTKDLLELKLDADQTQKELVKYLQVIETFYTDKIEHIKQKHKDQAKQTRRVSQINSIQKDKKHELEQIMMDAVESTKRNI